MRWPWQQSSTLGRELDPQLADLTGEGAQLRIRYPEPRKGSPKVEVWERVPSIPGEQREDYYRLPLLKEPVWIWSIPLYFYVGGVAGGSAVLAAFLHGKRGVRRLASACRLLAFTGTTVGPGLLTWDLGKRMRFLNMLRVFRPTSPMSIGSWTLAGTGGLATLALLQGERPSARPTACALASGGIVLSGYTGVLLGNTANPLWLHTRSTLPVLFIASSIASTSAILELLPLNRTEDRVVRRFGRFGKLAEAGAIAAMEWQGSRHPEASAGLREGTGGALWQGAKLMLAAGILVDLMPGRSRWKRCLGGAITTAGAICLRFALLESGKEAAREPRAVRPSVAD